MKLLVLFFFLLAANDVGIVAGWRVDQARLPLPPPPRCLPVASSDSGSEELEVRPQPIGFQRFSDGSISGGSNQYRCMSRLLLVWGICEIYSVGCLWFAFGSDRRWRTLIDWISTYSRDLVVILVFFKGLCARLVVQLVPVSLVISLYASVYGFNLSIISMFYKKKTRPILSNMANIRRGPVVQLPFWADPIKLFVNLGRPSGSLVTQLALDPAEFFFFARSGDGLAGEAENIAHLLLQPSR
jgi:hypothetical protein